jgi:hypothetical protein
MMNLTFHASRTHRLALVASFILAAGPLAAQQSPDARIDGAVRAVVSQLAADCPLADAGDQAAFDRCRGKLFGESKFRQLLSPITLWGRQRDAKMPLKDTKLTQFAPDVLAGMYVPLFMFDGNYKLRFDDKEKLWLATLGVGFRNRLQPGEFPYPFWHEADKWNTYENAKSILLWIDPQTAKVRFAQFSRDGERPDMPAALKATPPQFEGQWVWTDKLGRTQPTVTLFDGLFRADNPYKEKLSASYRELATSLRDGQCFSCHVPANPNGMSRLVLLQSPAHAAAEIKRVLRDIENGTMPRDEFDMEKPLDPAIKKALLERGGEFSRLVDLAHEWERNVPSGVQASIGPNTK